jgi:GDPmannose 4,6-dehydratase
MFGNNIKDDKGYLDESDEFNPVSPYAKAKLLAYEATQKFRKEHGLKCFNTISFNHESPFRGELFVTRKITKAIARIKLGLQDEVCLGNIYSKRDFTHAKDVVRAQYMIMNKLEESDDFVVASGSSYSIK